jgi:hypothetical protein
MPNDMEAAVSKLKNLLETHDPTAGLYVRVHGDHLILRRMEPAGAPGETEPDDRVRLTKLSTTVYGLSVRRHTGRWERTPFAGTIEEMVDIILGCMQHLVAPY